MKLHCRRSRSLRPVRQRGAALLTAGVDVQDDRLAVALWAWGRGEVAYAVGWAELMGDPITEDVWRALDELLVRRWPHAGGGALSAAMAAIDTGGHRTQAVYAYVRAHPRVTMAIKGANRPGQPVIATRPSLVDVHWNGQRIRMRSLSGTRPAMTNASVPRLMALARAHTSASVLVTGGSVSARNSPRPGPTIQKARAAFEPAGRSGPIKSALEHHVFAHHEAARRRTQRLGERVDKRQANAGAAGADDERGNGDLQMRERAHGEEARHGDPAAFDQQGAHAARFQIGVERFNLDPIAGAWQADDIRVA